MKGSSEDIALAVEIIRQLENLDYPAESILQAMVHVCKDTLKKLPDEQSQQHWQQKLITEIMAISPQAGSTH